MQKRYSAAVCVFSDSFICHRIPLVSLEQSFGVCSMQYILEAAGDTAGRIKEQGGVAGLLRLGPLPVSPSAKQPVVVEVGKVCRATVD